MTMGDNPAAQLHAEASLEDCISSHWGTDGLKPYARYSRAGGYQFNAENASGHDYCFTAADRVAKITVGNKIRDTMRLFMASAGHRDNILNSVHRKVNLGIAFDTYNIALIQHFEGDYIEYESLPTLENGVLTLQGVLKNGAAIPDRKDLGVSVFYDPLPRELTRGQNSLTYCYDSGTPVASLRPTLTARQFYPTDEYAATLSSCPDPYKIPEDTPPPRSGEEARRSWEAAHQASLKLNPTKIVVPWVTALEWEVAPHSFKVVADLGDIVEAFGDGVYTVRVWADIDREKRIVSVYSIFVPGA